MLKRKILSLFFAAVMLVTMTAPALTAQAEEALPEETAAPAEAEEALPEETAAPAEAEEALPEETAPAEEADEPTLTAQEEEPVFGETATVIPTVYLMYILRPYVGRTPGYMAGPEPGAGAHYSFRSVVWKDATGSVNGTVISNSHRFRPGRTYRMEVIVTPDAGYELAAIPAVGTPHLSASCYTVHCYNSGTTDRRLVFDFRMPAEFRDVTAAAAEDEFYYMPVYWAAANNITTGWSDGTFRPWNTCNRASIVTFLYRLAGSPEVSGSYPFRDPTGNAEFDRAITWAAQNDIVTGWSDRTFRPWNTCNRAAIITFCYRYACLEEGEDVCPDTIYDLYCDKFSDMTGNDEFDHAIAWAAWERISDGYADGTFRPWNTCNRAAAVTFIYGLDDALNVPG